MSRGSRRRRFLRFSLFGSILAVLLFSAGSGLVEAQAQGDGAALSISPAISELSVNPGESVLLDNFIIANPVGGSQEVEIDLRDITIADERGRIKLTEGQNERFSLSSWLQVEPSSLTLGPRAHQSLKVTIAVPEDAEPGGHYGAVFAFTKQKPKFGAGKGGGVGLGGVGLGMEAGVATPILLTVPGAVSTTGEIVEFRRIPFLNLGPVDFLIRFKNTGTVHYKPQGVIDIYDFFGNKAAAVSVEGRRVFPQTIRQLSARWNRLLLFGRYRAEVTLHYGLEGERQTTATIEFWAFPYKGFAAAAGIIIVLILITQIRSWWQGRGLDL